MVWILFVVFYSSGFIILTCGRVYFSNKMSSSIGSWKPIHSIPLQMPPRLAQPAFCLFGFLLALMLTASLAGLHTFLHTSSPVSIICPCMCVSITYARRALTVGSTPCPNLGGRHVTHTRSTTPGGVGIASLSHRDACTKHSSKLNVKSVFICGSSSNFLLSTGGGQGFGFLSDDIAPLVFSSTVPIWYDAIWRCVVRPLIFYLFIFFFWPVECATNFPTVCYAADIESSKQHVVWSSRATPRDRLFGRSVRPAEIGDFRFTRHNNNTVDRGFTVRTRYFASIPIIISNTILSSYARWQSVMFSFGPKIHVSFGAAAG